MQYDGWFHYDTALNRSILLAGPEGVLLVEDRLAVGQSAIGAQAGPIWHLTPVAPPVVGHDATGTGAGWVLGQNASVNLCVSFGLRAPATTAAAGSALAAGSWDTTTSCTPATCCKARTRFCTWAA